MRIWHRELIRVLPKSQLQSQYRELLAIKGKIEKVGTPNHLLVNKIMKYDTSHLYYYSNLVFDELKNKKVNINIEKKHELLQYALENSYTNDYISYDNLFKGWHDDRYLRQCLYNLEEKYVCGGIKQEEWELIYNKFHKRFDLINPKEVI